MGLSETLENRWKPREGCPVARLTATMPIEDQKAFANALEKQMPISLLINAMRAEGYKISRDSLFAHIKQKCLCKWD